MSEIFGGSKSKQQSSSSNQAYPMLSQALSPQVNNATGANNQMSSLLGLNGQPAQTEGFDNWRKSTGYQFGLNQGMGAITGGAASKGLLNSGSTAKALGQFGQDYGNQQFGTYLDQLMGVNQQGNQAGGLIANAGQVSSSSGSSKDSKGAGGFIGSLMGK